MGMRTMGLQMRVEGRERPEKMRIGERLGSYEEDTLGDSAARG